MLSDPACVASSLACVQADSLVSGVSGQQVRYESCVFSHHHHCDAVTQPTVGSTWQPAAACPPLMNATSRVSAFQQPSFLCDLVQSVPTYSTDWQQQVLLQQMQQQQSLIIAQQMQAQHPLLTHWQQMLHLQQQHQQAAQCMRWTLLHSQFKPDMMHNAFAGPVPTGTELPPQYLQCQAQLTSLLAESGLLPEKAHEVVQELQRITIPTAPTCQLAVPGMLQLLAHFDPLCQLHNYLLLSQFPAGVLPSSLLTSWYNVQLAYAQVVQLLARPNPLITPEVLESMLAQLPPPLNLNTLYSLNPEVTFESLYTKYLEFLLMHTGQLPLSPVELIQPAPVHGVFGNCVTSKDDNSSISLSKSVGLATVQTMVSDPVSADAKQAGTPMKVTRISSAGVDVVTQVCSLNRGPSLDLESSDVPGAKLSAAPRVSCSRHNSLPIVNGAKVSLSSVSKKSVDCPQGLADLDMALKEKLRPRTTKGMAPTVPEHTKASTAIAVSSNVISSISSTLSQSVVAPVTSDLERSCVTHVNASNGNSDITARNTTSVTRDASAVPKLQNVSVTKSASAITNEKTNAVKKQQLRNIQDTACKDGDVATDTTAVSSERTISAVPGNVPLLEVSKDMVKPVGSTAACSVQLLVAARSSSQFRDCASDHCLPSAAVSLPLLSLANSDVNRQRASDSAIAATATHLAQKHLQKKMIDADQESVSVTDVTTWQSHPTTAVSYK